MTLERTLDALLSGPPSAHVGSFAALDATNAELEARDLSSVERALLGGFHADRIGYAFAAGYRAALARLVPGISARACLAATEAGGAHPRAIATTLAAVGDAFVLDGTKAWVTLGSEAEELLVVASIGAHEGKNRLRVVRVPARREGVTIAPRDPAPFAPEIPHSEAVFRAVAITREEVLPGDGYDTYLKPFRTIEDLHVVAAFTGYLVSLARRHPSAGLVEPLVALAASVSALAPLDPSAPTTHVALAGAFVTLRALGEGAPFAALLGAIGADERSRYERDAPLLRVAERARVARLEAAWKRLAETTTP